MPEPKEDLELMTGVDLSPKFETDDEPHDPVELDTYEPVSKDEKLDLIIAQQEALVGEVRATVDAIADLKQFVMDLEARAQEMASPEKMQEAMQKMIGSF